LYTTTEASRKPVLCIFPSQPDSGDLLAAQKQIILGKVNSKMEDWQNRIPLVYVQDGKISVDNLENPLPVEVQNEVEVEIDQCTARQRHRQAEKCPSFLTATAVPSPQL
jgi:hypothetical protein